MNLTRSDYYLDTNSQLAVRLCVREILYQDARLTQAQLNEAIEIKELLRDVIKGALGAGAIALTGGAGGDTVVDIIFAMESAASILKTIEDAISGASDIAAAMKAAMDTNISAGADSVYSSVEAAVNALADVGEVGEELIEKMAAAIKDLLDKLASAVGDWVATALPDDAGLGGIVVREMLQGAIDKLGKDVYDILKAGFGKLPKQVQDFIADPAKMAAFLNELADKIIEYIDGAESEEDAAEAAASAPGAELGGEGGAAAPATTAEGAVLVIEVINPAGNVLSSVVKTKVRDFLDKDFREMIPPATEILNKLITAFFGAVALAQILAKWEDREEAPEDETGESPAAAPGAPPATQGEVLVRAYIGSILRESGVYLSHTKEPKPGEHVVNTNPNCKHYGSEGIVMDVFTLDGDMGKAVKYVVTNTGGAYSPGDILEKTLDQVEGR